MHKQKKTNNIKNEIKEIKKDPRFKIPESLKDSH
jgi:hypothetical protein